MWSDRTKIALGEIIFRKKYFPDTIVFYMLIISSCCSNLRAIQEIHLWVVTLSVCFTRKNLLEKTALTKISCFANKLRPQTPSTGFSDNWANQRLESLLPLIFLWWHLRANLQKPLVFRNALKAWSWSGKMVRMKKDANARVTGRRKQTKESAAEQLYMDNILMGLDGYGTQQESQCKYLRSLSSSQIFTEPLFSLDSIFLRDWYDSYNFIRKANFRVLTHWCIFIRSSLLSLFRTCPRSVSVAHVYL